MAGLSTKAIKNRIKSMQSTRQITKAMELVAASKLRSAQAKAISSRPYFQTLYAAMDEIADTNNDFSSPYLHASPDGKPVYVVIAGDRGLAGGYNNNIFKLVHAEAAGREMIVVPVGKKALEYYRHKNIPVWSGAYQEAGAVTVGDCFTMANMLCRDFRRGEFDEIRIAFTTFVSALSQTPTTMGLLPIVVDHSGQGGGRSGTRITYEPDSETVYDMIVPEYLGGLIYGALCESFASEQGARRMAMDSATKNAGAMIDDLTLRYNRARQGAITQEITEIVAGAQYE